MSLETENSPLVGVKNTLSNHHDGLAKLNSGLLTTLLGSVQAGILVFFVFGTTYSNDDYSPSEYMIFRDIMVMLLLGFGYLMTFLKLYGLGAVGFTMMISILAIQLNIVVELIMRFVFGKAGDADTILPLPLKLPMFIDGEFAAATALISYGALIGRASPVQLVLMTASQSIFYALNKVVVVLGFCAAEDVGGSITIHMFGAFFGLACSYALGPPKSTTNADPNRISDILAMIGSTLLWVYWPSFVGATESGVPLNENFCVVHTILALIGSTGATFYMSQQLGHGKMDPVHIANSTLAGGVAVGSSARLSMTPAGALILGVMAGMISVYGYAYSTPYLESKGIYDTCGVGNLHGLPSLLGGIGSIVFVLLDSDAEFLSFGPLQQSLRQLLAVVMTVALASSSGFLTGKAMTKAAPAMDEEGYEDAAWWEGKYFNCTGGSETEP
ncbi:ammonium transporter family-domain containing protein [Nitzschia inconspicua]|uniref:Ammonium transporter family-domain containing protein n=1 Tax=Nitzschia inconspicua TaxID=303405 RepID=A0A9K3LJF0_9STRA|nr:ammonium transporter family-domain containing protein [Nitzschia inconspicua]